MASTSQISMRSDLRFVSDLIYVSGQRRTNTLWSELTVAGPFGPADCYVHWPELARRVKKAAGPAGQRSMSRPVFATTACLLTLRPTSLTFLPFTPLPVSFAQVLTTLSSVVHLSVQYPMVKGLSHIPPLLLGTLFLSRSALLIKSLLSDPELKHTFSVLPTNCLNVSVVNVICFPQSFISCCTAG